MTTYCQIMEAQTKILLAPGAEYSAMAKACRELKKLFSEAVEFDEEEISNQHRISTNAGMALDPRSAASCLDDVTRTRKFILGLRDAIDDRLKQDPNRPITIFYAGTGPFASLITPLTSIFSPSQMQLVLMEINPASFKCLGKMIASFEMEDYVIDLVQADAATYSIPASQQPDIVVSETMNNALRKEPQVAIVANLMRQCNRHPLLIPGSIRVDACLYGNTELDSEAFILIKSLLDLDSETSRKIGDDPNTVAVLSSGVEVIIPDTPGLAYDQLVLRTSMHIYGEHKLLENESGLTIPHIVMMKGTSFKAGDKLNFRYSMGADPGFTFSRV